MKKQNLLSRAEMKKIVGGVEEEPNKNCCCYHYPTAGVDMYACGLSMADAKAGADEAAITYGSAQWCCASCPTSVLPCIV